MTRGGFHIKPWYTLREYADMTGTPIGTVRRQADRGTLQAGREGGRRVIYLATVQAQNPERWASIVLALQVNRLGE